MIKLDGDEKKILKLFENKEMRNIKNMPQEIKKNKEYATSFLKRKQINIRVSKSDLNGIKRKSLELGIPYQTLISSLLHRYVTGKIAAKF